MLRSLQLFLGALAKPGKLSHPFLPPSLLLGLPRHTTPHPRHHHVFSPSDSWKNIWRQWIGQLCSPHGIIVGDMRDPFGNRSLILGIGRKCFWDVSVCGGGREPCGSCHFSCTPPPPSPTPGGGEAGVCTSAAATSSFSVPSGPFPAHLSFLPLVSFSFISSSLFFPQCQFQVCNPGCKKRACNFLCVYAYTHE